MASDDFNADQIHPHVGRVRSSISHLSPQDPRRFDRSRANVKVHPSCRQVRNRYKSVFTEVGLDGAADTTNCNMRNVETARPGSFVQWRGKTGTQNAGHPGSGGFQPETTSAIPTTRDHQQRSAAAILSRLSFVAVMLAIMVPVLHMSPLLHTRAAIIGAEAGPIAPESAVHRQLDSTELVPRQSNPTDSCLRWSQQSAVVNGTLYTYGGRAKKDSQQGSNTWSKSRRIIPQVLY